ncbi:hypothetical protein LJB68_11395 [bacterium 210820-DFI.6.52]|nr:hypothetical protein [bacterium 210820-DFI.6.52]
MPLVQTGGKEKTDTPRLFCLAALYLKRLDNQVVLVDREKLSAEERRELEALLAAVAREQ